MVLVPAPALSAVLGVDVRQVRPARAITPSRLAVVAVLAAAGAAAVWLLASGASGGSGVPVDRALAQAALEDSVGVRVVRVAVTGGAGIVDLRYRVVDPDKAAAVHDPEARPALVDERTGEVIDTPFMGHTMRPRTIRAGVIHYLLFVNRKGLIEPGGRVTVVLGGARLEHVIVR